jgi:serine/threonine protein kinase
MVRDIALGMNWLHNTKPAIIHRFVLFFLLFFCRSSMFGVAFRTNLLTHPLRDLKLGNVLYRKRGNWYEIKVSDFGTSPSVCAFSLQ